MGSGLAAVACDLGNQHKIAARPVNIIDIMLNPQHGRAIGFYRAIQIILAGPADEFAFNSAVTAKIQDINPCLGNPAVIRLQGAVSLRQQTRVDPGATEPAQPEIHIPEKAGPAQRCCQIVLLGAMAETVLAAHRQTGPFTQGRARVDIRHKIDGKQVDLSRPDRPGYPQHRRTALFTAHQPATEIATVDDIDRIIAFGLAPEQNGAAEQDIGIANPRCDMRLAQISAAMSGRPTG